MNGKDKFTLVRKPSSAVEKAALGAKRILSGMITDTLALAKRQISAEAQGEELVAIFERANELLYGEDPLEGIRLYKMVAEKGDADAQYVLGYCYESGEGVEQDYAEAEKWYRKAAEQNHAGAQCGLGYLAQDYAQAVRWYRKAAEQNHAEAQYALADCYYRGDGVPQNMVEAVQWYLKAAEQGNADAQYRLGMCYWDGRGVVKDEAEAKKWQDKAREKWRKIEEERLLIREKVEREQSGADF